MIQYDYTQIEIQKAWNKKHYETKTKETVEKENIILSENLSYVFRMFLVSMLFIMLIINMG